MTIDTFWQVIARSRSDVRRPSAVVRMDRQAKRLKELLEAMPQAGRAQFARIFSELLDAAYRWDLWAAAHVLGGGCSDDGFSDFRSWLISMGRSVFESALKDPETLTDLQADPTVEDFFFEEFQHVALQGLAGSRAVSSPREPTGRKWSAAELPAIVPRIWAARRR
jgi:hypothetical protein